MDKLESSREERADERDTTQETSNGSSSKKDGKNGITTKQPTGSTEMSDSGEGEPIDYPTLKFIGSGSLAHTNGAADVKQSLTAEMDDDMVRMIVVKFRAVDGDNTGNVNDEIEKDTGPVEFNRPSKTDLEAAEDARNFLRSNFLVYGERISNRKGGKFDNFVIDGGDFLPILIAPAAQSRYEEITSKPLQYRSMIRATYQGKDGSEQMNFDVVTTISMVTSSESQSKIRVEYVIPQDVEGEIYEVFPIAKRTEFIIDHNKKRIIGLNTLSHYEDDGRRDVTIDYQLCEYSQNGKVDSTGSCTF